MLFHYRHSKLIRLGCSVLVFSHSSLKSDKMFYWDELIQKEMCFLALTVTVIY